MPTLRLRGWVAFGAGAALGVTAGALLMSGVFAADPAAPSAMHAEPTAAPSPAGLPAFDDCERLRKWYVAAALPAVGSYGFESPNGYTNLFGTFSQNRAAAPASGDLAAVGQSGTGTNVQEAGVDEPDIAKTNGTLVVRVQGRNVVLTDVSGDQPRELSRVMLPRRMQNQRLLLAGDRVVVFGEQGFASGGPVDRYGWDDRILPGYPEARTTYVTSIDISDPADAHVVNEQRVDGDLISARKYADGTVRIVLTTGYPPLDFVFPNRDRTDREARRDNRQIVREAAIDDWLPKIRDGSGKAQPLLDCADVRHPRVQSGLGTISVVSFPADDPSARDTTAVTSSGDLVYSSTDRLYIATTAYPDWRSDWRPDWRPDWNGRPAPARLPRTQVHAFALDGARTSYVASGSVPGTLKDRWSFDEYDGHLRVATALGRDSWRPRENAVVVLAEQDGRLREVGRVGGLGRNEQIKSVRWFGDLAVVVTYRVIDPLYTVDLSSPTRPRVVGQLRMPGFSSYLHPVGQDRLLGVGEGSGAQVTTYDLGNPADVRRIDALAFGQGTGSPVEHRPRTFTYLPEQKVALLPVRYPGAPDRLVAVALGDGGALTEQGSWDLRDPSAHHVRALPLGGGRVALVDEGVRVIQVG